MRAGANAEFAGVGHHDGLLRLADHGAKRQGFFGFDDCDPPNGVDSADAHEDLVQVNFLEEVDRGLSDRRERACPLPITHDAGNLSGGGAGRKADGLMLLNQVRGSQAVATLLERAMLHPSLEEGTVAEGLVQQALDQGSATRRAPDQAFHFEFC